MYELQVNKAVRILKNCKDYAMNLVKDCFNNYDFPRDSHLLLIDTTYHSLRGQCNTYLVFSNTGLQVKNEYSDHFSMTKGIGTDIRPYRYDYNETNEITINLACTLAKHWSLIKSNMEEVLIAYNKMHEENEFMLSNFTTT